MVIAAMATASLEMAASLAAALVGVGAPSAVEAAAVHLDAAAADVEPAAAAVDVEEAATMATVVVAARAARRAVG